MASVLGNNYWLIVGPVVIVLALSAWVSMAVWATRRGRIGKGHDKTRGEASHRGPVSGGIIEGSPVQRNRRDEAPRRDS